MYWPGKKMFVVYAQAKKCKSLSKMHGMISVLKNLKLWPYFRLKSCKDRRKNSWIPFTQISQLLTFYYRNIHIFLNYLRVCCRHDIPSSINTTVCLSQVQVKLLYNRKIVIKINKLILINTIINLWTLFRFHKFSRMISFFGKNT